VWECPDDADTIGRGRSDMNPPAAIGHHRTYVSKCLLVDDRLPDPSTKQMGRVPAVNCVWFSRQGPNPPHP